MNFYICIYLVIHHPDWYNNVFPTPKKASLCPFLVSTLRQPLFWLHHHRLVLSVLELHVNMPIQHGLMLSSFFFSNTIMFMVSVMLFHVPYVTYFYGCVVFYSMTITVCLFILLLMNISSFLLLWIKLLWIFL